MDLKGKKYLLLYYLLLLLVIMFWSTTARVVPPTVLRFAFLLAVVLPIWNNTTAVVSAILIFYTLSTFGLSCFMPTEYPYYLILFGALFMSNQNKITCTVKYPLPLLGLLCFNTLFVGLVGDGIVNRLFYGLLIVMIICGLVECNGLSCIKLIKYSFIIVSVSFSLMQILFWENFAQTYIMQDFERSGWTDPNYFGMIIGLGTICLINEILDKKNNIKGKYLILIIAGIALNTIALLMNASRGAILAVLCAFVISYILSDKGKKSKIVVAIASLIFAYFLYLNNFMDFLIYRFQADDTGSGRDEIWLMKYSAFINQDIISQLFGIGFYKGLNLGSYVAFHNDYIAFLVEYGYIGLILNILIWLYPFKNIPKKSSVFGQIASCVIYMAVCGCTLEILTTGTLIFWLFYVYILSLRTNYLFGYDESIVDNKYTISRTC